MAKAAILVLADTDTHEDLGRVVNGLMAAKEFKEAGDDVKVIFDGAATKWPGVLSEPQHKYHKLYEEDTDALAGACGYCARAFRADQDVQTARVHLLEEYEGHPSVRRLVTDGYQVITF
jgi:hypothetical protein